MNLLLLLSQYFENHFDFFWSLNTPHKTFQAWISNSVNPKNCRVSLYCVDSLRVAWEISNSKHHVVSTLMVNFRQEKTFHHVSHMASVVGEQMIPNATARNWDRFQLLSPFSAPSFGFIALWLQVGEICQKTSTLMVNFWQEKRSILCHIWLRW